MSSSTSPYFRRLQQRIFQRMLIASDYLFVVVPSLQHIHSITHIRLLVILLSEINNSSSSSSSIIIMAQLPSPSPLPSELIFHPSRPSSQQITTTHGVALTPQHAPVINKPSMFVGYFEFLSRAYVLLNFIPMFAVLIMACMMYNDTAQVRNDISGGVTTRMYCSDLSNNLLVIDHDTHTHTHTHTHTQTDRLCIQHTTHTPSICLHLHDNV